MKAKSRRQERVARLIQEALSRLLIEEVQRISGSLVTVTHVDITADLLTARVYLSVFGSGDSQGILTHLEKRTGHLRKALASSVKLKYNPMLFFLEDPRREVERRLDEILLSSQKDKPSNS